MTRAKIKYRYFSILFMISGFAGIIYESVWIQYLKILYGHAAFAQTFILVIFLAGMAVGAWLGSKIIFHHSRLFAFYALAEVGIGISALLFHPLFEILKHYIFSFVYPLGHGFWVEFLKWGMIILLTLPSTVLLGSTFPLLATALQRLLPERKNGIVSQLYFLNSFGASIGILICAFVLIPDLGLPGTLVAAGILNFIVAAIAFSLAATRTKSATPIIIFDNINAPKKNLLFYYVILAAWFTGASSFMYEIGWVRMLSMVLGSSVQAFEIMLSAFIFGLAIGALWIKSRIGKIKNHEFAFLLVQLFMGIFAILSIFVYNYTFNLMEWMLSWVERSNSGFIYFNAGSHIIAFVVMLPATVCAGMTLPLMIHILQQHGFGEGVIGKVYAIDTAGGIIGVLLAVHLIMPLLGLKNLMIIAGVVDILLGFGMLFFLGRRLPKNIYFLLIFSGFMLLFAFLFFNPDSVKMASGVFRYGNINEQNNILFQRDGKTATITVFETPGGNIVLSTNGKPDASINRLRHISADDATQVLLAALPMSLSYELSKVAIVGLGSGKTAHVALMNYQIRNIDVIEIEPAVVEASQLFRPHNENIFNDFRLNLHINDARTFLNSSHEYYDLIISEPSNPWVSGMSSLFSEEFYQIVSSRLTDDGLFVQWLHTYEMSMPLIASVAKAFSPWFADYQLYFLDDGDLVFLGKKKGILNLSGDEIFYNPEMKAELHRLGIESPSDFWVRIVGNKTLLDPYFFSFAAPANSDYRPFLEYEAPKARFLGNSASRLQEFITFPAPIMRSFLKLPMIIPDNLAEDYTYSLSQKYSQAGLIFKIFEAASNSSKPDFTGLEDYNVLLVKNILPVRFNDLQGSVDNTWPIYLKSLAESVNPYLESKELNVIWNYISEAPAFSGQPDAVKLEVELYKAAGLADYETILDLTFDFRQQNVFLFEQKEMYKLAVSMWALMMTNRNDEALLMWDKFSRPDEIPAMLQFLGALAEKRATFEE